MITLIAFVGVAVISFCVGMGCAMSRLPRMGGYEWDGRRYEIRDVGPAWR